MPSSKNDDYSLTGTFKFCRRNYKLIILRTGLYRLRFHISLCFIYVHCPIFLIVSNSQIMYGLLKFTALQYPILTNRNRAERCAVLNWLKFKKSDILLEIILMIIIMYTFSLIYCISIKKI